MYSFPLYCTDPGFDRHYDISHDNCPYGSCNWRDMARSSYIYVVQTNEGELLRAFTVKHELRSWIAKQPDYWSFMVHRMGDNSDTISVMRTDEWMPDD